MKKATTPSIDYKDKLISAARLARRYSVLIFVLFLLAIYGFLAWRVFALNQTQPDPASVSAQLKTTSVPRIDPDVVAKIQQLQDNSVSVQSLFDQARQNPFQE